MSTTHTLTDQFSRLRQQRGLMGGLLLLLVIVVFWVALGLFSSQQKFAVPKAMRELARPLSPIADEKTLAKLETKKIFSQAELANFTVYKVIVNEVNKQLRLVDISYSEKVATNAAKTNIQPQVVNESDLTSSSSALLVEAPLATETGVVATPTPLPQITP